MKLRLLAICLILLAINKTMAVEPLSVSEYRYSGAIPVFTPFIVDKEDVNGNRWSNKNLSQTMVDFEQINRSSTILQVDTAGLLTLPFDSIQNRLHLFQFVVDADQYTKSQLEVHGTGLFEVFVDGAKKGGNTYKAQDIDDADPVYINLNMLPQQYRVTIKYLTEAGANDTIRLKSSIKLTTDTMAVLSAAAVNQRRVTLHDIIEGKRLTNASLSPSGNYYIVSYKTVHETEKSHTTHELIESKGNRLIYRFPATETPAWMPSSDRLYFWRNGKSESDLIALNPKNMQEEVLIQNMKSESARITPDEQYIILTIKDKAPEVSGSIKRLIAPDDRMDGFRDRTALYRYNIRQCTLEQLTFGSTNTQISDISTDSRHMVFFTSQRNLTRRPFMEYACYIMDLETLKTDTIFQHDRYAGRAVFSPDGKQLLFTGTPEAFNKIGENILPEQIANGYDTQAFIMDIKTREVTAITKDFYPTVIAVSWRAKDNKIYIQTTDKDRKRMYRYDPKSYHYELLTLQEDIIQRFSLSNQGNMALYIGQSVSNSNRLYAYNLSSLKSTLLSDPFEKQLNEIKLGDVHDFNFVSGKDTIEGRYYLPPNFDKDKQYPMIVYYYGGTTPTARTFESNYPLHVYAALGYVVYTLQPSGTIGFGQEFSARHVNAWGKQTADEIILGTRRFCETHPFVNKDKIGCIGASYGGFMTQYLQTQTNLFAAAVSHAGISNIASYWGEGYWGYTYGSIANADSYPWNNPELFINQSPLFHADKISTPLLLLHGMADTNVPVGESIQMYNALKILGKEVEFVQVSGENHSISNYKRRLEWNRHIFAWFAKWLKDEPTWWNNIASSL